MKDLLLRVIYYLKFNTSKVRIGKRCKIGMSTEFEGMNVIQNDTSLFGSVGYGSYVGARSIIVGKIGRFCSIGNDVRVTIGTHPINKYVSTHPTFYSLLKQNGETFVTKQKFDEFNYVDDSKNLIVIENDVWIGSNTLILSGITIGNGAIIAAGSVVTQNVEPYSIVGGVPARLIKHRFDSQQIEMLLRIEWWSKPIEWIKMNAEYFEDVELFLNSTKE